MDSTEDAGSGFWLVGRGLSGNILDIACSEARANLEAVPCENLHTLLQLHSHDHSTFGTGTKDGVSCAVTTTPLQEVPL